MEITGKLEFSEKKLQQITSECASAKKRVQELELRVAALETENITILQQ